jgi:RimJ/RimL family protein N-acetyltransferase
MRFIKIGENGTPKKVLAQTELISEICSSTVSVYAKFGFAPPWIGYLAEKDGKIVGSCAFKSPPNEGKVEIANFTFLDYQGKGIATEMVEQLIKSARKENPTITITAQTLPNENASTTVLKKNNFREIGSNMHPEDGLV